MNKTAFPLCWPAGWPRTEAMLRQRAKFKTELNTALNNLKREINLMGGTEMVLSSNYTLGVERPKDTGVVAYFTWQKTQLAIPCDRWDTIQANVQAIALTVEAMRGMERWGAKHMIKAMFTGFKALPERTSGKQWFEVLNVAPNATHEEVLAAWKQRVKEAHPDHGGTNEQFHAVQDAINDFYGLHPELQR